MPVLINIGGCALFGTAMAWVVRRSPVGHREWLAWPLLLLLGFQAVLVTPVTTYLFCFFPQWSMHYWFDPQIFVDLDRWIGPLSALVMVFYFATSLGAYSLSRYGLRLGNPILVWTPAACGSALITAVALALGDRSLRIGDYDEYWAGEAPWVFLSLAGWIGLALWAAAALFVAWVHRRFDGRDPSIV